MIDLASFFKSGFSGLGASLVNPDAGRNLSGQTGLNIFTGSQTQTQKSAGFSLGFFDKVLIFGGLTLVALYATKRLIK